MDTSTCSVAGCDDPVRARGKCARHYFRDYKRSRSNGSGHHRPPLDGAVYKLRFKRNSGASHTIYYSDPRLAEQEALKHAAQGVLLFYAKYTFDEQLAGES